MSFKIGDKVKYIEGTKKSLLGKTGSIFEIIYDADNVARLLCVKWKDFDEGHRGCNKVVFDPECQFVWNVEIFNVKKTSLQEEFDF